MSRHPRIASALVPAAALLCLTAAPSFASVQAQACRARALVESQCTWLVLDELDGGRRAAEEAERAATSGLTGGCSAQQYQMVLLHGTEVGSTVVRGLRRGPVETRAARAACAAAASTKFP